VPGLDHRDQRGAVVQPGGQLITAQPGEFPLGTQLVRYRVYGEPATHVRLKIFPDGGVARLRLYGLLTDSGVAAMRRRRAETA
jgi:Allantoicase repeat